MELTHKISNIISTCLVGKYLVEAATKVQYKINRVYLDPEKCVVCEVVSPKGNRQIPQRNLNEYLFNDLDY